MSVDILELENYIKRENVYYFLEYHRISEKPVTCCQKEKKIPEKIAILDAVLHFIKAFRVQFHTFINFTPKKYYI
jgi:hypothetical protein